MVVCKAKALRSKELGGSFCPSPQGLANSSLSKLNPYKGGNLADGYCVLRIWVGVGVEVDLDDDVFEVRSSEVLTPNNQEPVSLAM